MTANAQTAEMPVIFVSHGSPMLPFEDIPARKFMLGLGAKLPRPKAILCISAHWESPTVRATGAEKLETIHDFFGFPKALYELEFDAPGSPELATRAVGLLKDAGIAAEVDAGRGRDHGCWNPLMLIYPQSGIPVVQLSLIDGGDAEAHLKLGEALAPLRREGVLIFCSGGAVHNLRWLDREGRGGTIDWAEAFDRWVDAKIAAGDAQALAHYRDQAPNAALAHPSEEHFLPLLVAMGAAKDNAKGRRIHESFNLGSLSMAAYEWR
ncbi:DODA-type extradiol aromatic ring-opening family dioxygenase [Dongia sedimenti]|uniref:Class III extradiol ring-cleavage dioxygenase n=1 Tax=Dongia sedimenti TaxID=3064282 RepID=A0ABU0YIJ8_9PROT|nr:class III extradiol ring-cleavage dioxygenase [Rhodospirillaceae bacterium R-7]